MKKEMVKENEERTKIKANDMRPKSGGCETAGKLTDPPSMKACASRRSIISTPLMIIKLILAFYFFA